MDGRDIGTVVFPDADLKFFWRRTPKSAGNAGTSSLRQRAWT